MVFVVDPAEFYGSSDTTLLPLRGLFLGCHRCLDFVYEKLLVELPGCLCLSLQRENLSK